VGERVFLALDGPISNKWRLSLAGVGGSEVLIEELSEDGKGTVGRPIHLDLSNPEDLRALVQIQQARGIAHTKAVLDKAIAEKGEREREAQRDLQLKAVDDMLEFLQARTVTRPTEKTGKVETLEDQVQRGEVSREHASEAVRIAIELGHLPKGSTLKDAAVRGQSMRVKSGPLAVYEFINRLHDGADPMTVLEETAETYIKLGLARGELDLSILSRWRAELEAGRVVEESEIPKWSEVELTEWFSGQAQAYFVGKSKEFYSPIPHRVKVWLEKFRAFLEELFKAARHLMQLEKEGKLDAGFEVHLAQSVGLDPTWVAALRQEDWAGGAELRAIARGEASGIGEFGGGLFFSQRKPISGQSQPPVAERRKKPAPKTQVAWHGSSYRGVEKEGFKLAYVGSGQRQANYGWGIYLTKSKELAERYMRVASRTNSTKDGQLYKVSIPEDSELLSWDAPFSEQSAKVKQALAQIAPDEDWAGGTDTGRTIYAKVGMRHRSYSPRGIDVYSTLPKGAAELASKTLGEHGIGGLRHFDSDVLEMTDGEGAEAEPYSYVIWDEARLTPDAAQIQTTYQLRAFHGRRYEQAKAEGQTELTAQQWQQVHSPEFKAWFGDWQRLRAQERIDAMEPVELQLDEKWRGKNPKELREAVVTHLRDLAKAGVKANHPELGEVGFADNKIGKIVSTSADAEKLHATLDIA